MKWIDIVWGILYLILLGLIFAIRKWLETKVESSVNSKFQKEQEKYKLDNIISDGLPHILQKDTEYNGIQGDEVRGNGGGTIENEDTTTQRETPREAPRETPRETSGRISMYYYVLQPNQTWVIPLTILRNNVKVDYRISAGRDVIVYFTDETGMNNYNNGQPFVPINTYSQQQNHQGAIMIAHLGPLYVLIYNPNSTLVQFTYDFWYSGL